MRVNRLACLAAVVTILAGCATKSPHVECPGLFALKIEDERLWCIDSEGSPVVPVQRQGDASVDAAGGFNRGLLLLSIDAEDLSRPSLRIWDDESQFNSGTTYYKSGRLMAYAEYADNVLDGVFRGWHENGNLKMDGRYVNGRREGPWRFWNEDGSLKRQAEFVDDAEVEPQP